MNFIRCVCFDRIVAFLLKYFKPIRTIRPKFALCTKSSLLTKSACTLYLKCMHLARQVNVLSTKHELL